jgi:hypothetical protein
MPSPGVLAVAEPAPLDGAVMAPRGAAANHCYAVPKPFEKIGAYAAEVLGKAAGEAIAAIANPRNALHPGIRRRTLDMLFPRERPLKLAIPDIKGPEAYDQALAVVHAAWTSGQISPAEAETCMRLVHSRYRGWVKAEGGKSR